MGCGNQKNLKYHRGKASWPIAPPERGPMRKEDVIFEYLQKKAKKKTQKVREREAWISEANWRLPDQRTTIRRNHPV